MIVRTLPTYGQKPDKIASNDVNIYIAIYRNWLKLLTTSQMTATSQQVPQLFMLSFQTLQCSVRIPFQ